MVIVRGQGLVLRFIGYGIVVMGLVVRIYWLGSGG